MLFSDCVRSHYFETRPPPLLQLASQTVTIYSSFPSPLKRDVIFESMMDHNIHSPVLILSQTRLHLERIWIHYNYLFIVSWNQLYIVFSSFSLLSITRYGVRSNSKFWNKRQFVFTSKYALRCKVQETKWSRMVCKGISFLRNILKFTYIIIYIRNWCQNI